MDSRRPGTAHRRPRSPEGTQRARRGDGGGGADVVEAGLQAREKQENEQVKRMVDRQLAEAERRKSAGERAEAACRHLSALGKGVRDGTASWTDVLQTSATIAQLEEQLGADRPVMAGTSTAGLGQTTAMRYLSSSDPSLRAMGEQQARLAWVEATRWCTSR